MLPAREGEALLLKCRSCGYVEKAEASAVQEYRLTRSVEEEKRVKTASVSEARMLSKEKKEEEREMLQEYYEIFLETFGEGGEE